MTAKHMRGTACLKVAQITKGAASQAHARWRSTSDTVLLAFQNAAALHTIRARAFHVA